MNTLKIELKGTVPSKKNSKRRVQRGAHLLMIPSQRHEDWHMLASVQLYGMKVKPVTTKITRFVVSFWVENNRARDLSNMLESINDLLVDHGIIEDDKWQITGSILMVPLGIDKENPRAIIEIDHE